MIEWKENNTPVSTQFGDIYFSPENGWEETIHVFLNGNRLEERLKSSEHAKSHFSVLELGFGTGLNFFATWHLWQRIREKSPYSVLRFVSYELYPLEKSEIIKALSVFPEMSDLVSVFSEKYRFLVPGCNSFVFEKENLILDLWIGDAESLLPRTSGKFDAFFLDGFAPSKNPELWSETIASELGRLANTGSTLATFTVAKLAKDSLTHAGFSLSKLPGYGRKREMLVGTYSSQEVLENEDPVYSSRRFPKSIPKKILVIGGGLAGASVARAFAWRGFSVRVWDEENPLRASYIPKAISHPHITKTESTPSLFTLRGLGHSLRRYPDILPENAYGISGTLQATNEDMPWARLESGTEAHHLSEEIALLKENLSPQFHADRKGIRFPSGFWTETDVLVRSLLSHPKIEYEKGKISRIRQDDNGWILLSEEGNALDYGSVLVLANSFGIEALLADMEGECIFPLVKVRGQLEELEDPNILKSDDPVRISEHYLTPNISGIRVLGSTFDEFDLEPNPREKDRNSLLEYARKTHPDIDWSRLKVLREFVGIRSQTKDRFPVLGPLHSPHAFKKQYSGISLPKNKKKEFPFLEPISNLYVFGGLGSRGVISCLLGGEILASSILGEPLPVEKDLYSSVHPSRFLFRKIRTLEPKGDP